MWHGLAAIRESTVRPVGRSAPKRRPEAMAELLKASAVLDVIAGRMLGLLEAANIADSE